jgi:hypothetical protein
MTEYTDFRQRLGAVLRTLAVKQASDFLIAEGQWQPGQPSDPTFAMWMVALQCRPFLHMESNASHFLLIAAKLYRSYCSDRLYMPGSRTGGAYTSVSSSSASIRPTVNVSER